MFPQSCGQRSLCLRLGVLAGACFCLVAALSFGPEGAHSVNAGDDASIEQGQEIFRFDTFGDEQVWTDTLRMHEVIEDSLDPITALKFGLRVDAEALPPDLVIALELGVVDLTDPQTTLALIDAGAVIGIVGTVEEVDDGLTLTKVGITCALCHSDVDHSLVRGIGSRLDGWPNLDLDVGKIVALSPAIGDADRAVFNAWGPGKYDPRYLTWQGGVPVHNPDGLVTPVVIPPAYGLARVAKETYTADGPISYWNNYVAVTQMGGHGTFIDPRLGLKIEQTPDLVTPKLPALLAYQLSLKKPPPPAASFRVAAAARGKGVFMGAARCGECHKPPLYTDIKRGVLHKPRETGMDPTYAQRSVTKRYRTTPLRALWQHPPYFHDGSAETLDDVVKHYNRRLKLHLTERQKDDLVEFLKSL